MTHRNKLKLARREMAPEEIKGHVHPFESKFWLDQKKLTALKVEQIQNHQHEQAALRRAWKEKNERNNL